MVEVDIDAKNVVEVDGYSNDPKIYFECQLGNDLCFYFPFWIVTSYLTNSNTNNKPTNNNENKQNK